MKRTAVFLALLGAWGVAHAGTTADGLSTEYTNTLNGASGVQTKINAATSGAATCDLTSCGGGTALSSLPAPTTSVSGGCGVMTLEEASSCFSGKRIAMSYTLAKVFAGWTGSTGYYLAASATVNSSGIASIVVTQQTRNAYGTVTSTTTASATRTVASMMQTGVTLLGYPFKMDGNGMYAIYSKTDNGGDCGSTTTTTYRLNAFWSSAQTPGKLETLHASSVQNGCTGGSCFPAGTLVLMASGEWTPIESIQPGERVSGMNGSSNTVVGLWRPKLNDRALRRINDAFETTGDHMMLAKVAGEVVWGAIEPELYKNRRFAREVEVTTATGPKKILNGAIAPESIVTVTEGGTLVDFEGTERAVTAIRTVAGTTPDMQLYTLHTDGTESFVVQGGYVVDGIPQKALSEAR